jgi:predicted transglutaminase-like cysteine proteinase
MVRRNLSLALLAAAMAVLCSNTAYSGPRSSQDATVFTPIAEASPTLAPFQHVRFCLRYPSECKSDPAQADRIELNTDNLDLLKRVNRSVNAAIIPMRKTYGAELADGWTIAPQTGDCNDYAVTKRHELLESGLPSRALRLSVVKTVSGIGHLILVVSTTKGEMVLDNLTESIVPWQSTDYHWIKIQSANDARFWLDVKGPAVSASLPHNARKLRLAARQSEI